jgi:glycerol-3-phosphate acyltransferase PlsY
MEIMQSILLAACAFMLGACPFSLWIGRWFLHKDIREYGDGNPGTVNVFLAGGRKSGVIALLLDVGKGFPFVFAAHSVFHLPYVAVVAVGICAILGHAFSPVLKLQGGKAVAVTFGVLMALPAYQPLLSLALLTFLAFILIDNDAWTVIAGAVSSFVYLLISRGNTWETQISLFIAILFVIKFFRELQTVPRPMRLVRWFQRNRRNPAG